MRSCFSLIASMLAACLTAAFAVDPLPMEVIDAMSDDDLRAYREKMIAELQRRAKETPVEETPDGKMYVNFFCTVYYTPMESGFTEERGFDATPATAPGLGGRMFPRSFLRAVKKEGFGRMKEPVNGKHYMAYSGHGAYRFAKEPLGSRGNPLQPTRSCAVSTRNPHLKQKMNLRIDSATVQAALGSMEWEVADTGGGVHPLQIDLYWGEDEPRGAVGRAQARPSGTMMEYAFDVKVLVK